MRLPEYFSSSFDALANHFGGEAHRALGGKLEQTVAGVALHILVAVVLGFNVNDCGAMRALAFVLAAIVPLVVVGFSHLS